MMMMMMTMMMSMRFVVVYGLRRRAAYQHRDGWDERDRGCIVVVVVVFVVVGASVIIGETRGRCRIYDLRVGTGIFLVSSNIFFFFWIRFRGVE